MFFLFCSITNALFQLQQSYFYVTVSVESNDNVLNFKYISPISLSLFLLLFISIFTSLMVGLAVSASSLKF